jgi:hypothetical protein
MSLRKYVDTVDDPQRAWLEYQQAKRQAEATAEAQGMLAGAGRGLYWSHSDGCRSVFEACQLAYPICPHGLRAAFVAREEDGYVA